jgi:uncharacterized protein YxeA
MKTIIYLIIFLILTNCIGGGGFVIDEKVTGNYYLTATDVIEQLSLSYHTEDMGDIYGKVIGETVFSVGFNNKYIIVKQHPTIEDKSNLKITNYYILPLKEKMDWKTNNGLIGPITLDKFNLTCKELHIEDIKFAINYKNLE